MSSKQDNTRNGLASEIGKRTSFNCPRQEAYLNLMRTHALLSTQVSRLLKEHGLTDPQYNALRILRGEGKPMQTYQIAERMISLQTDISRLVERMVTAGLVDRNRSEDDRRVVWVSLTEKGQSTLQELDAPINQLHDSQFQDLTEKELNSLSELLFRARK
ncbi:MarR family transcriptional regulator [Bremerella sp. JC817]|uniref:MarR family winged helix-turn-helix transcriptional regulator n=1 Tax=Bremerella sp. JC817 TaxID=3231756 RepID=UPI00345B1CD9